MGILIKASSLGLLWVMGQEEGGRTTLAGHRIVRGHRLRHLARIHKVALTVSDRRLNLHHEKLRHVAELQAQLREYQFAASARAQSDHSLHSARCDALSNQSSRGDGLA